jgi:lactate permease
MWGACLVGMFVFGLAYVYHYSGMASSLTKAFSSTNAMFGKFQALVGQLLGFPSLLLPSLNSVSLSPVYQRRVLLVLSQ